MLRCCWGRDWWKVLVTQSCPTLYDLMAHSPPGSSVLGNSPGKNPGVGNHSLLQGSSRPRDQTQVFCTAGRTLENLSWCHRGEKFISGLTLIDGVSDLKVAPSVFWVSLGAQMVKNLPATRETQVCKGSDTTEQLTLTSSLLHRFYLQSSSCCARIERSSSGLHSVLGNTYFNCIHSSFYILQWSSTVY